MEENMKSLLAARNEANESGRSPSTYSVGEFARTLGVGEMTVYRAIHAGRLPAIKFGGRYVVPAKALDELIEAAMSTGGLVDIAERLSAQGGVA